MGNSTLAFPTPGDCGGDTSEKLDFDFIYSSLLKVEEYAVDLWYVVIYFSLFTSVV